MCQALHHFLVLIMFELTLCCECKPAWSATDAIYCAAVSGNIGGLSKRFCCSERCFGHCDSGPSAGWDGVQQFGLGDVSRVALAMCAGPLLQMMGAWRSCLALHEMRCQLVHVLRSALGAYVFMALYCFSAS
jgi:hypothetical protein